MKIIVLLIFFTSAIFASDFFKNGNYVVDKIGNLYWQDTKENITILKSQEGAVKYCENLNLSGFSDWKLPTREQYKNIINKNRKDELMINRRFEYILSDDYWTQDRRWQSFGRYGFYILFKSGNIYFNNRNHPKYVRCVRVAK